MEETSSDGSDKSLYTTTLPSFHEQPDKELKDFFSISRKNLETSEKRCNKQCKSIKEIGKDGIEKLQKLINIYVTLLKETNKNEVDKLAMDAEMKFLNKKASKIEEENNELESMVQKCVGKLEELGIEKTHVESKTIKKHKAYQQTIKYFKTRFNTYVKLTKTANNFMAIVCLFTQEFNDEYSFTVFLNTDNDKFTLENVKPKLEQTKFDLLREHLDKTNNISEILCIIRKLFLPLIQKSL